jgi:hypothetical protein
MRSSSSNGSSIRWMIRIEKLVSKHNCILALLLTFDPYYTWVTCIIPTYVAMLLPYEE